MYLSVAVKKTVHLCHVSKVEIQVSQLYIMNTLKIEKHLPATEK